VALKGRVVIAQKFRYPSPTAFLPNTNCKCRGWAGEGECDVMEKFEAR